ncbi:UNKNOWN [Stylonychia lemnae]|uniref:Uncharacterized protein n=1 Tax=Stylonychia lemnae TaxID=5949 RepID=A0A078ADH6_STYLE|nr:UNKNOWN [Stylonychia lemnae]|eukprot:CDW78913.1 UNKNOWN [Stylonychia lemnae]
MDNGQHEVYRTIGIVLLDIQFSKIIETRPTQFLFNFDFHKIMNNIFSPPGGSKKYYLQVATIKVAITTWWV